MRVRGDASSRSRRDAMSGNCSPSQRIVVGETYQAFLDAVVSGAIPRQSQFLPLRSVWRLRQVHEQVFVLVTDDTMCQRWPEACRDLLARGDRAQWLDA